MFCYFFLFFFFFFFKQKTAYEIMPSLVGSEMCIRDSLRTGRVHGLAAHADAVAEPLDVNLGPLTTVGMQTAAGVPLVTGHRRRAVVEHNHESLALVVACIDQRRHARMEERRV